MAWLQDIAINTLWYNSGTGNDPSEDTPPPNVVKGAVAINTADGLMWVNITGGGVTGSWELVSGAGGGSGSGTVGSGTAYYFPFYTANGTTIDDNVSLSGVNNQSPILFHPVANATLPNAISIFATQLQMQGSIKPLTYNNAFDLGGAATWWNDVYAQDFNMQRVVSGSNLGVTLTANAALAASYTLTFPAAAPTANDVLQSNGSGSLSWVAVAGAQNLFSTIAVNGQTDVVADSNSDTLTFAAGNNVTITTTASTDTVTIASSISNTNTTYSHSWVDDSANAILRLIAGGSGSGNDDLTIVAGSNITLTPSGDNLTIAASGGGGGSGTVSSGTTNRLAYYTGTTTVDDSDIQINNSNVIIHPETHATSSYDDNLGTSTKPWNTIWYGTYAKLGMAGSNTEFNVPNNAVNSTVTAFTIEKGEASFNYPRTTFKGLGIGIDAGISNGDGHIALSITQGHSSRNYGIAPGTDNRGFLGKSDRRWTTGYITTLSSTQIQLTQSSSGGLVNASDTTTGLYLQAVDDIRLKTNNVTVLQVNGAGNGSATLTLCAYSQDKTTFNGEDVRMTVLPGATANHEYLKIDDSGGTDDNRLNHTASTRRVKKNIRTLAVDSSLIYNLTSKSFEFKENDVTSFGLIAEEVHDVLPALVSYRGGLPQAVKVEDALTYLLLEELKKLKDRIVVLEAS